MFRTWVERYHVREGRHRASRRSTRPNGGYDGFPEKYPAGDGAKTFFVPKMCNHCAHSPCVQVCPVGRDLREPRRRRPGRQEILPGLPVLRAGLPLRLPLHRSAHEHGRQVHLCYHRITKGLTTACCEVCPTRRAPARRPQEPRRSDPRVPARRTRSRCSSPRWRRVPRSTTTASTARCGRRTPWKWEALLHAVEGFMYPNEMELQWSVLIVLYPLHHRPRRGSLHPRLPGAGLQRGGGQADLSPRAADRARVLLVAPLPLQLHLGHPERSFEMYLTPHTTSAMAMFGFVYLWYLHGGAGARDLARVPAGDRPHGEREPTGWRRPLYRVLALGSDNVSPRSLAIDEKVGPSRHDRRHPVGLPAPRLRRLHLRLGQGQPVVVDPAHADRLPVLGDRLGNRGS